MRKIYLDPGHGGVDSGAVGNKLREKDLTLKIAKKIRDGLKDYECSVRMSRTTDKTMTLKQRTDDANKWGADYFLSIHINAFNGKAQGYEDFIFSGKVNSKTVEYQKIIHEEIMKQVDFVDRGMKRANFHVLRETKMPALLSENGFIDHKGDAEKLKSDSYLDKIAQGHVNGLVRAFGLKKKNVSKPTPSKPKQTMPRSYVGKRVESIHNGNLRFYNKPSWQDKDVYGHLKKGYGFPEIVSRVKVGSGYQYKVKNSKGKIFYVTASPVYVRVV